MFEEAAAEGLRFDCIQCSACCSGSPGLVRLSREDLARLAKGFSMDPETFVSRYCRWLELGSGPELCLKECENYDCVFLQKGACSVYQLRPTQCRTYPFWDEIVESKVTWNREAACCPGIGKGTRHSPEEISDLLIRQRASKPLGPHDLVDSLEGSA